LKGFESEVTERFPPIRVLVRGSKRPDPVLVGNVRKGEPVRNAKWKRFIYRRENVSL